jgi:hypothetical protein
MDHRLDQHGKRVHHIRQREDSKHYHDLDNQPPAFRGRDGHGGL